MKLAFVDGQKYIADARSMNVSIKDLLSENYDVERRKLIGLEAIMPIPVGTNQRGQSPLIGLKIL